MTSRSEVLQLRWVASILRLRRYCSVRSCAILNLLFLAPRKPKSDGQCMATLVHSKVMVLAEGIVEVEGLMGMGST